MAKSSAKKAPVEVTKELEFTVVRETSGAFVFAESKDGEVIDLKGPERMDAAVVGTLYIRKKALGGATPQTLSVMVTYFA